MLLVLRLMLLGLMLGLMLGVLPLLLRHVLRVLTLGRVCACLVAHRDEQGRDVLAVLLGILINNSRLTDLRLHIDTRFAVVDRRFDEMKEMWHSELHRVEEVLDARLKHLEER